MRHRFLIARVRRAGLSAVLLACVWFALGALPGCGDDEAVQPILEVPSTITFPLAVGHVWEYAVADTTNGTPNLFSQQTDSISGLGSFDELPYFALVTRGDPPETTWLRQEEQRLKLRPSLVDEIPSDPIFTDLTDSLRASLPWLCADFVRPAGSKWSVMTGVDTIEVNGYPIRLAARVTAASLGRLQLTVPAGVFADVYGGRLTVEISFALTVPGSPFPGGAYTLTEELYVKDGVGIVQRRESERMVIPETPTTSFSSTARLASYRLARR